MSIVIRVNGSDTISAVIKPAVAITGTIGLTPAESAITYAYVGNGQDISVSETTISAITDVVTSDGLHLVNASDIHRHVGTVTDGMVTSNDESKSRVTGDVLIWNQSVPEWQRGSISAGTGIALNKVGNDIEVTNTVSAISDLTGTSDDITEGTTKKFLTVAEESKLAGIEGGADVTDSTNVTSSLVSATTISTGDKTTIQTNLGVDPSGTDNSTDVTLSGAYDYITITGQTITRNQVDYSTDISNKPSIPQSGVDFDPVGTDNSTDVTLAGTYNYLTLLGQEITLGQVDYSTDISNRPSIPQSGVDFDPAGTDNSTDVTLAGTYDYLTLTGQQITLGQVDYSTDISNKPSIPQSGVDFDPAGTDNSTDVTLAGTYDYLTLSGQQITLGQVDYSTDVSNKPSIPVSGVDFDPVGTDNSTDATVGATASDVLKVAAGQVLGAFDAGSDKLVFWDDSESKLTYATIGTNLTMTSTTLDASGGGGSANMVQDFSAPTSTGEFQDGARLVADAYGTAPSATAGTLVNFGNTSPSLVGAQSVATAATGMLTVVTDAASGDELLVEGVIKMSSNTGWSTAKMGAPLYMSTTSGEVTTTAPSTAGEFVRVVGHVVDGANSTIYFKPDNTWLEL